MLNKEEIGKRIAFFRKEKGITQKELADLLHISYLDSGLDVRRLYTLKEEIMKLNSNDTTILSADYADAWLFQADTSQMREPVYSCITCVPGSKEKLAREYRYNQEICMDVAANAMNFILQHGMKPMILKAMVICGNYSQEQLYLMAQAFRKICDKTRSLLPEWKSLLNRSISLRKNMR